MTAKTAAATILGVSPEADLVRLWMWSQAASLQTLGTYTPKSAMMIAARLLRSRPDLEVFIAPGVVL